MSGVSERSRAPRRDRSAGQQGAGLHGRAHEGALLSQSFRRETLLQRYGISSRLGVQAKTARLEGQLGDLPRFQPE